MKKTLGTILVLALVLALVAPAIAEENAIVYFRLFAGIDGIFSSETTEELKDYFPTFLGEKVEGTQLFDNGGWVVLEQKLYNTTIPENRQTLSVDFGYYFISDEVKAEIADDDLQDAVDKATNWDDGTNRRDETLTVNTTHVEEYDEVHDFKYLFHIAKTPVEGENARYILVALNNKTGVMTLLKKGDDKKVKRFVVEDIADFIATTESTPSEETTVTPTATPSEEPVDPEPVWEPTPTPTPSEAPWDPEFNMDDDDNVDPEPVWEDDNVDPEPEWDDDNVDPEPVFEQVPAKVTPAEEESWDPEFNMEENMDPEPVFEQVPSTIIPASEESWDPEFNLDPEPVWENDSAEAVAVTEVEAAPAVEPEPVVVSEPVVVDAPATEEYSSEFNFEEPAAPVVVEAAPAVEPEPIVVSEPVVVEAPATEESWANEFNFEEPAAPVVEPEPIVESAPVVEPEPIMVSEPVVESAPATEEFSSEFNFEEPAEDDSGAVWE